MVKESISKMKNGKTAGTVSTRSRSWHDHRPTESDYRSYSSIMRTQYYCKLLQEKRCFRKKKLQGTGNVQGNEKVNSAPGQDLQQSEGI